MLTIANFIDGSLVTPESGAYLDNIEPATGRVYSRVPDSDGRDVDMAVDAAKRAFRGWSRTPAAERSRLMLRVADLIERDLDSLARAESIDNGKPLWLAKSVDIPRAVANFRFFATAILHESSEAHFTDDEAINYTRRAALGVCACISPWNLPLYLFTWKIAPALASGNTVVGKPSEITPMTAYRLSELCIEAGLPPGVLNVVHGKGPTTGAALVEHDDVRAISFTGGTATGEMISRIAAPQFKKLSLEMGGKNPTIIFADADFDAALTTSVRAAFANQGEICLCGSRIFVERSIADRFTEEFVVRAKGLRVGDPLADGVDQGAVVSKQHFDKIMSYIEIARDEGGEIRCGGEAIPADELPERCRGGWFIRPTVITGLDACCRTNQEEIFGPVVTIVPFDSEDEAIEGANSTRYGLAASIWTQNLSRAHRVAGQVESGIIWVNCWMLRDLRTPFGGMKQSGVGREGGYEALRFFTEAKNVCVKI